MEQITNYVKPELIVVAIALYFVGMALKQAQALMRQYSITDIEVELSAVTETGVGSAASLPSWHQLLISRCAKAFGVECYLERCCGTAEVRFFGLGVKPELAAYAYEVLLRQLKKSRREYIKTELVRVRSASNKTARADQFCMGWVYAVAQKVEEFAMPPEEKGVLERYRQQFGEMGKAKTRDVKGKTSRMQQQQDLQAGHRQGRDAQLHQAMGADKYKQIGA
mgnify:CR=1 FL=1